MHRNFRFSILALAAACALVAALPAGAQECATFSGVEHCPLGTATLNQTAEGLAVEGFGDSDTNGVALSFADATSWRGQVNAEGNGEATAYLRTAAIADGVTSSTATFEQNGDLFELSATFTGSGADSTYSAMVYNDGVFQGGVGGLDNDQRAIYVDRNDPLNPWQDPDPYWWWPWWWPWGGWGFDILATNQACQWTVGFEVPVSLHLADGTQVMGDEVRLVEEVSPGGGYVYLSFDGITAQGDLTSFTFTGETLAGR
jgi:hypothetical protein